ncbi:uncharacterized protein LOC129963930 isoform X1 [Argiope bruennichi]|uniref:uncharacterized protein LOC129963930 isoform X1 n=1 Tax=Argiope bruennichi TaxID=94029 RepID=UPI0024953BDD|nr:uncharacterized protein LOC129963930 isoform X1 [Argiope bruennichi]
MLPSISSNSLKLSAYSNSHQAKQVHFSASSSSLVHSSTEYTYSCQDDQVLSSVYSNTLKHISSTYSDSHQDKQVFSSVPSNTLTHIASKDSHQGKQAPFSVSSNSLVHSSKKYSYSCPDNQVLSSVYSNSLGYNSSKYLDSHQDKQVFFCASANSTENISVKYLDSCQEAYSSVSCSIDIENPYYENDCTHPDSEDDDFILGINVDPYIREYGTPPEMEDYHYDVNSYYEENGSPLVNDCRFDSNYVTCNEDNDSLLDDDWGIHLNYDADPNYEENDSLPEDHNEVNFKYDAHPNYEKNSSSPGDDWGFNSNQALDFNYDKTDPSPGDDWTFISNYDAHNEENDSISKNGCIFHFKYNGNPNYEESDSPPGIDSRFDSNHYAAPNYRENSSPPGIDWRFDSNHYAAPNYRENDSPPGIYWRLDSNDDDNPNYEESDSYLGQDWGSNSDYDTYNEENGSIPDDDEWFNSKYDVDPYNKEYDSPPEDDFECISNYDVNPHNKENKLLDVKNEHAFLLQFYETLVDELMGKFSIGHLDIRSSLQYMISNHRRVVKGQLPSETDYCNISYCLGYLHRYAACHSVLISDSVSAILNSSSSYVLNTKLSREQLNVMFLGGGPGNDFVGFLTALHSYRDYLLNLDVTVVDKMSGWEDVFNETVQKLKKSGYGKVYHIFDDVAITTSFISADLKNGDEWNTDMQSKLQRADIVFLVKILSHVPNDAKLDVLENIILHMKPGALLIFADSPYPSREFESVARRLRLVYKSRKKSYAMKAKKFKFGYHNITRCTAQVRIFERW